MNSSCEINLNQSNEGFIPENALYMPATQPQPEHQELSSAPIQTPNKRKEKIKVSIINKSKAEL